MSDNSEKLISRSRICSVYECLLLAAVLHVAGCGIRRTIDCRKTGRRLISQYRDEIWRAQHTSLDLLQGRPTRRPDSRSGAQGSAQEKGGFSYHWLRPPYQNEGVDGARWLLRTSNPLCLVTSGVGGFDSLALPPTIPGTRTPDFSQ